MTPDQLEALITMLDAIRNQIASLGATDSSPERAECSKRATALANRAMDRVQYMVSLPQQGG